MAVWRDEKALMAMSGASKSIKESPFSGRTLSELDQK